VKSLPTTLNKFHLLRRRCLVCCSASFTYLRIITHCSLRSPRRRY